MCLCISVLARARDSLFAVCGLACVTLVLVCDCFALVGHCVDASQQYICIPRTAVHRRPKLLVD